MRRARAAWAAWAVWVVAAAMVGGGCGERGERAQGGGAGGGAASGAADDVVAGAGAGAGAGAAAVAGEAAIEVRVAAAGLSAAEVETMIAAPLERALGEVDGLRGLETRCREGAVVIIARVAGAPADAARRVQAALSAARSRLPAEAEMPLVLRRPARAVARYALTGPVDIATLTAIHERAIRARLERLPGVAQVASCGGGEPEVALTVDAGRLAALGVPFARVMAAATGRFGSLEELLAAPIAESGGAPIALRDVAAAADAIAPTRCAAVLGGAVAVAGEVHPRPGAAGGAIAAAVGRALDQARRELPPGVKLTALGADALVLEVYLPAGAAREQQLVRAAELARRAGARGLARWRAERPEAIELVVEAGPADATAIIDTASGEAAEGGAGGTVRVLAPAGHDLEISLLGDELGVLEAAAGALVEQARGWPEVAAAGVRAPRMVPEQRLAVDRDRLAAAGMRSADLAVIVRAAEDGAPAGSVAGAGGAVPPGGGRGIRVRLDGAAAHELAPLPVVTASGEVTTLGALASFELAPAPVSIERLDRRRRAIIWLRPAAPGARGELVRRLGALRLDQAVEVHIAR